MHIWGQNLGNIAYEWKNNCALSKIAGVSKARSGQQLRYADEASHNNAVAYHQTKRTAKVSAQRTGWKYTSAVGSQSASCFSGSDRIHRNVTLPRKHPYFQLPSSKIPVQKLDKQRGERMVCGCSVRQP